MISAIDNMTALLSLALDAAGMRQQAIAHNIANANTPGYRRASVSFESRMVQMTADLPRGAAPSLTDLSTLRPVLELADAAEPVQLDREMTELSETVLHQQALLKALNKQFELIGMAINEGKR
ncbi:flagellar basal body rod protein FlgB [Massilia sp. TSP1-1-2]|uniref:flagellar basal body rod protein FlgB n=1 Tax=Massilia sp. TSP1-1-2 TaxID=2804649 RepID=UPI003CE7F9FD